MTGRLLKIGAEYGTTPKFYKKKFNSITGIDISEDNFRYTKYYFAFFLNKIFISSKFHLLLTEVSDKNSKYENKFRKNLIPGGYMRNFTYQTLKNIIIKNEYKIIDKKFVNIYRNKYIQMIEFFIFLSIEFSSNMIFQCKKKIKITVFYYNNFLNSYRNKKYNML